MGKYRVTFGQSLYDIALHIYGSVEGITDLLINNEGISLDDRLKAGDELTFTDDYIINKEVVAYNQTYNITPSRGERSVYLKSPTLRKTMEIYTLSNLNSCAFTLSGGGNIEVDWGDNSALQKIEVSDTVQTIAHTFDSKVKQRRKITFYMDCNLKSLDFSELKPTAFYILRPLYVERFSLKGATLSLESLLLLNGVFECHLTNVQTADLTPLIELKELRELSLTGFVYPQPTIDSYLIGLVDNYDNRRNCHITMTTEPSPFGMEAIQTILNEPEWNFPSKWQFTINGEIYKSDI